MANHSTPPGPQNHDSQPASHPPQRFVTNEIILPKNKSTSNLLSHASGSGITIDTLRPRMSFDAGSSDKVARSPIVPEHEHGLGASGLRRIRQQPLPRPLSGHNFGAQPRSASLSLALPRSRNPSASLQSGSASPTLNFSEDLSRFPSESLHSFSFAHQSEEFIHSRQNVLKRSIDFMRDRLGWAASNPGLANAQAKLSGDQEVQSMMELLTRANLIGQDASRAYGLGSKGPLTGPPDMSGENIFDKSFLPRSESPDSFGDDISPRAERIPESTRELGLLPSETPNPILSKPVETADLSGNQTFGTSDMVESPPPPLLSPRAALKRTLTDTASLTIQSQLNDALAQPYLISDQGSNNHLTSPTGVPQTSHPNMSGPHSAGPAPHGHGSRWAPAAQAIFTTEAQAPWTITAANDLACLVFGVTRAEVRKLGILEVVREERRKWLEDKLKNPESGSKSSREPYSQSQRTSPTPTTSLNVGNGVTAKLLSKPPSRQLQQSRRSKTDDGSGATFASKKNVKGGLNHASKGSRGVLLCGDVVPIQKRNGALGSASLWVKEKRGGLIWVLEEIAEDVVYVSVDEVGCVTTGQGAVEAVWGTERLRRGMDIKRLIPAIPRLAGTNTGALDYQKIAEVRTFTARTSNSINIPVTVEQLSGEPTFRVSSFPHIAGIIVLSASSLAVTSSNTVFSSALFGQPNPDGLNITQLIPGFDRILHVMTDEDKIELVDGIVIPEHSFRRARALLAMREGKADAAAVFLRPSGLPAQHSDGAEIMIDVQMRVVKSEKSNIRYGDHVITEEAESHEISPSPELVYALWVTYSRHLHATNHGIGPVTPLISRPGTPPRQPSPGQPLSAVSPQDMDLDESKHDSAHVSLLTKQFQEAMKPPVFMTSKDKDISESVETTEPPTKKTINDFVVLEDMGQGAYGQVKLCRYKKNSSKKVVIKYVTKRRILVDTWTRDRRLGTVPLEIHVLDYLRREDFKHPNIVEMSDFFEDDINYYIEMVPHGLPGMDLFDYIELRVNMDEDECRQIFVQVAEAIHHLHTKAKVVHRDIKDENVILDGEGNIKLIDFGSAAYIKNGPFDVFVGTIDYAAPEVLAGKSYRGKEQDVWALGILLYTIVYKENPFYSIDEIMDHDLRVPYIMSEESIELIRLMLNRDVDKRITITQVLEHPWCKLGV
ncbi:Pkinase-domain-containing protein [Lophium mytilinum]|uniref:non-specific serine/threonine protein kinase n=1 Tax=Lophium mytilinum TaxID=390894 RepID=A0A6A6Q8S5_9PEZI|nr:Pkinase-domain-containing protein [Lophium mytilinum]